MRVFLGQGPREIGLRLCVSLGWILGNARGGETLANARRDGVL